MLMWYLILVILIISTGAGLIYIGSRLNKFAFMSRFGGRGRSRQRLAGLAITAAAFTALSLTLNLMNAVVCLLHLVILWLLSDSVFWLISRFREQPFRRYYAGITAILTTIAVLTAGWYLNHHVWTTTYTLSSDKNIKNLRIIQFADAHIGTTFDSAGFARHIREIQKHAPDIVFIVGDFVDDGTSRQEMVEACQALGTLKTAHGVYFAFGNHDRGYYNPANRGFTADDLIAELQKNNVTVLQDQTQLIENMFYVIGRKDYSEILRGNSRLQIKELTANLDPHKFMIVLDHQPNDYANLAAAEADLVLSGHTHGGQLFPLNKVGEWIGANDQTYGLKRLKQTDFIVTSGLSDWSIKFKTGTKSEFVIIDLKPQSLQN